MFVALKARDGTNEEMDGFHKDETQGRPWPQRRKEITADYAEMRGCAPSSRSFLSARIRVIRGLILRFLSFRSSNLCRTTPYPIFNLHFSFFNSLPSGQRLIDEPMHFFHDSLFNLGAPDG